MNEALVPRYQAEDYARVPRQRIFLLHLTKSGHGGNVEPSSLTIVVSEDGVYQAVVKFAEGLNIPFTDPAIIKLHVLHEPFGNVPSPLPGGQIREQFTRRQTDT